MLEYRRKAEEEEAKRNAQSEAAPAPSSKPKPKPTSDSTLVNSLLADADDFYKAGEIRAGGRYAYNHGLITGTNENEEEDEGGATGEVVQLATGEAKALVPVSGNLAGRTLRALNLRVRFGISVYAIRHPDGTSTMPNPELKLARGDVLVVVGAQAEVEHLRELAVRWSSET